MVIIAVSDIHLGYSHSNASGFQSFLQTLNLRTDIDRLVILGDCVDMWRRDVSGLFLENEAILQLILELQTKTEVDYIVGNHDYHLRKLSGASYHFEFKENMAFSSDGVSYIVKHGYEFDPEQQGFMMDLLCDNLSNEGGQVRSDFWILFQQCDHDLGTIKDLIETHGSKEKYLNHLMLPTKDRLSGTFDSVEQRALKSKSPEELLVFGHTHRPFVSPTQNLVNTGSWNNDEDIFNTWAEIAGRDIKLMQLKDGKIIDITIERTRAI